jgi:hypothetical protein
MASSVSADHWRVLPLTFRFAPSAPHIVVGTVHHHREVTTKRR